MSGGGGSPAGGGTGADPMTAADPVTVAVVDSGANAPHAHLPEVAGGVAFRLDGEEHDDFVDRLGHGTAVAAAIHEKAPRAAIYAVKVFDDALATSVAALARAIDWASERRLRIVNLSLGTPNAFRAPELEPPVRRARERGTIVVSAARDGDAVWWPGCMEGVVGVVLDDAQPRERVRVIEEEEGRVVAASPYPRPIPGVPVGRNLSGISFAVANAAGALAGALEVAPEVRTAAAALELLADSLRAPSDPP